MRQRSRSVVFASLVILGLSCTEADGTVSPEGDILQGEWGGDNVSLVVGETVAHVHFGCTIGDFPTPIELDADGRFSVSGSYMIRAYPVPFGPSVPAQMAGEVRGGALTLTIAVNDTVTKELVVFGPSTVTLGQEPQMGTCPICISAEGKAQRQSVERKAQGAKGVLGRAQRILLAFLEP